MNATANNTSATLVAQVLKAGFLNVGLEQEGEAWHAWRAEGLGASAVAIVLDESPYQTAYGLWAEKLGLVEAPDLSRNPHVQRGVQNEEPARQAWEVKRNGIAFPACLQSKLLPWLRVSLDGITPEGEILEIKCPSPKKIAFFLENWVEGTVATSYQDLEDLGFGIYYGQVQYQMVVAGSAIASLWIWDVDTEAGYEVIIPLNEEYCAKMLDAAAAFWQCIETKTPPPLNPERDVLNTVMLEDEEQAEWRSAEAGYTELDFLIKAKEAEIKELKKSREVFEESLLEIAGIWPSVVSDTGFKLTRFTRAGSVDYGKLLAKYLPNLTQKEIDAFRKESSSSVRITVPKTKK